MPAQSCEEIARLLEALAHPLRPVIVTLLREQEMHIGEIALALGVVPTQAASHVAALAEVGILVGVRRGPLDHYYLRDSRVLHALCLLEQFRRSHGLPSSVLS
ncbi:MAG: helix-turn-helix domain-containing protein [Capsulimonadales bacterium]|nr:helix-turn-helix domain-containing protein [Capsulimonadales bacterium]